MFDFFSAHFLDASRAVLHRRLQFVLHVSARVGIGRLRSGRVGGILAQVPAALLARTPFEVVQQEGVFQERRSRLLHELRPFLRDPRSVYLKRIK